MFGVYRFSYKSAIGITWAAMSPEYNFSHLIHPRMSTDFSCGSFRIVHLYENSNLPFIPILMKVGMHPFF